MSPWSPFSGIHELGSIQDRLNKAFGPYLTSLDEDMSYSSDWCPAVDIAEDNKEYTLTADLPDIKREDVHVTLRNGSISLTGERKRESQEANRSYLRVERYYGKFERTFALPENILSESIKAEFTDGTLQVHLPKSKESTINTKEITIS
jgi:HSP20 family protein